MHRTVNTAIQRACSAIPSPTSLTMATHSLHLAHSPLHLAHSPLHVTHSPLHVTHSPYTSPTGRQRHGHQWRCDWRLRFARSSNGLVPYCISFCSGLYFFWLFWYRTVFLSAVVCNCFGYFGTVLYFFLKWSAIVLVIKLSGLIALEC
jgi:hypothetical protein